MGVYMYLYMYTSIYMYKPVETCIDTYIWGGSPSTTHHATSPASSPAASLNFPNTSPVSSWKFIATWKRCGFRGARPRNGAILCAYHTCVYNAYNTC